MNRPLACFVVGLFVAATGVGCVAKQVPREAVFDPAEYAPYAGLGKGTIEGQAFLTKADGTVVVGAGRTVLLNPRTAVSTEWYQKAIVQGLNLAPSPVALPVPRQVRCDAEGRFTFHDLPAGSYYAACDIRWVLPSGYWTGGVAHAEITVYEGRTTKAILTR